MKTREVEVLVVDDASTDGSAMLAEELGARVLRLEKNAGPSAARNHGAVHAHGRALFFVDADVEVHSDAVQRVLAFLDAPDSPPALFGSYDTEPRARTFVSRYRNLLHHYVHQHGLEEASTFWAGCGAIQRSVFEELGGFDEENYPRCIEDIELGYRLRAAGHGIRLDKKLFGTHLKRWTLLSLIHTDIFCRALPWAHLNRTRHASIDDLNLERSQKLSVLLVGLALITAVVGIWWPGSLLVTGAVLLGVVALNAGLFRFFASVRSPGFAIVCIPLHLLYFLYSGSSYVCSAAAARMGIRLVGGNRS